MVNWVRKIIGKSALANVLSFPPCLFYYVLLLTLFVTCLCILSELIKDDDVLLSNSARRILLGAESVYGRVRSISAPFVGVLDEL